MKRRVLSIDVGIKNLAFCVVEVDGECAARVVDWKVVSVIDEGVNTKKLSLDVITEQMVSTLMQEFGKFDPDRVFDLVLIENQPTNKNRTMKSVSVEIYTFFTMLKMMHGTVRKIRFVSAKHKLSLCDSSSSSVARAATPSRRPNKQRKKDASAAYRDRKKQAVELVRSKYLPIVCDQDMARLFDAARKKDDLADCLLQCIYYVQQMVLGGREIVKCN
jgi:hypothetical protein